MPKVSTSWKPGHSGNPNGAPKKEWTWASLYARCVEEKDTEGIPYKILIVRKLVELARRGDINAMKELTSRMDGMPTQVNEEHVIQDLSLSYGHSRNNAASTEAGDSTQSTPGPKV